MSEFYVWYSRYDPDSYVGHKKVHLRATNMEDAEREARELLSRSSVRGPHEYIVEEVVARIGPKIYE